MKLLQSTNGLTANYNNYSSAELERALQSWVEPYPKPIILNHDLNSEPIGRVMAARMDKEADGSSYVRLQIAITDPVAAQKVADKRYLTGSVGGRAAKAVCSISGEDLAQEDANGRPRVPKYKRGSVYKGKVAYIDMQDISFKEYSFVNQPADQRSGVRNAKSGDGAAVTDSENWVARSTAFVLHMDSEDIVSLEENESILKNMKKKESKPIYLHLKGAFLTALALQESETSNNKASSLLSSEDSVKNNSEENNNMEDVIEKEDILAVAEGLSEDLSNIAAGNASEDAEKAEESSETAREASEEANENSDDDSEKADEQAEEVVDSEEAEEPKESSDEKTASDDEPKESAEQADELNADKADDVEQDTAQQDEIIKTLEDENARLKAALHKTLAERVVDTKIGLGLESAEERENLIEDHVKRTASSLADSMRDLAKLPAASKRSVSVPTIESELTVSEEENVVTIDAEVSEKVESDEDALEKLFVDALMGRRKL